MNDIFIYHTVLQYHMLHNILNNNIIRIYVFSKNDVFTKIWVHVIQTRKRSRARAAAAKTLRAKVVGGVG